MRGLNLVEAISRPFGFRRLLITEQTTGMTAKSISSGRRFISDASNLNNVIILLLLSLAPLATEACASTIQIVNINDVTSPGSSGPGGSPYQLDNTPFVFRASDVASLQSLDRISFAVPISNLQSAPGQTYFNMLFLALNGLNTGSP